MSLDALRSQLRGPDGALARMRELQARFGIKEAAAPFVIPSAEAKPGELAPMSPLMGEIGPARLGADAPAVSLKAAADTAARSAGVDPKLFAALVTAESDWDPTCTSKAGAIGLTQLMPETAKSLGITRPYDPVQNLQGGARYLRSLLDRFGGDVTKSIAAYNAGPGAVERAGGIPPYAETRAYVRKVLSLRGQ